LKSFLDTDIIITNGSEISKETLDYIKQANEKRGVIILTDPDYPGLRIRNKIVEYVGECKHAFIEKSKAIKGKKVGIAETKKEDIIEALEKVVTFKEINEISLTYDELFELGLIGRQDSKVKRKKVAEYYHLGWCNAKSLYKRLNMFSITKKEVERVINDDNSN
jgi:ribonuclease M5